VLNVVNQTETSGYSTEQNIEVMTESHIDLESFVWDEGNLVKGQILHLDVCF
jgi:hypothetical protein